VTRLACITHVKSKNKEKKWRKSYTKNQIAIDTQTLVILAQKTARGPRHDSKEAIPTIRKTKKYKPIGFSLDRAFDEEKIHRVIKRRTTSNQHDNHSRKEQKMVNTD